MPNSNVPNLSPTITQSLATKRTLWKTRIGFIFATTGAAVGLGNIWKFPYMAGNNGGGVFVVLYLACILLIGIPAMIAELLIGRIGRKNSVNSLTSIANSIGAKKQWGLVGWLGAITLLMVLSFYSVVAGWSIAYLALAFKGALLNSTPLSVLSIWEQLLNSPLQLTTWHSVFMILTISVIIFGVNNGIEQCSKLMMPSLFLVLIALVIFSGYVGNLPAAIYYLFSFKIQELTWNSVLQAMGQAFFSLATGAGAILIYGSYLSKNTKIFNTVAIIAFLDVLVAILSGLAIFSIVFAFNLAPNQGAGLMFQTLPIALAKLPFAQTSTVLFFILLLFAAWSSSISMAEPLVALLNEKTKLTRTKASILIGLIAWSLGLLSVFSFNILADFKLFNKFTIFEILTDLPTNILLPLGGLLFTIFAGWIIPKAVLQEEFDGDSAILYFLFRFVLKYITPIAIGVVLVYSIIF